jgi:ATP phosphoribosyltransferase
VEKEKMTFKKPIIRLALPKGRLLDNVLKLLSEININFKFKNDRDYNPITNDKEISAKVVKVRAIPQLLALGQFTVGFVGLDLIKESGYDEIKTVLSLRLNPVRLVVAVHKNQKNILSNPPKRPILIATEYENIAHEWAMKNNLAHIIIQTWGSTEAFAPDDADIIFDNIDTGRTMEANNLVVIDEIMQSSTYFVVNVKAYKKKDVKKKVDNLIKKLKEHKK